MWFDSYQHRIDDANNKHSFSVNYEKCKNHSMVLKVNLERSIFLVVIKESYIRFL